MLTCCLLNGDERNLFSATVCPISLKGTSMMPRCNTERPVWRTLVSQIRLPRASLGYGKVQRTRRATSRAGMTRCRNLTTSRPVCRIDFWIELCRIYADCNPKPPIRRPYRSHTVRIA